MALKLYIPTCINRPAHALHPPPLDRPVRVQIEGPLVSIQKLVPEYSWQLKVGTRQFPQPGGDALAKLTYQVLYGTDIRQEVFGDMVVRDEYLGWVMEGKIPKDCIDYYGVTFDHLVPPDDLDPEVLQINIIEMDDDEGVYANTHLPFRVDPADYTGKKVLAVPRCCQKRRGTQDRPRVNWSVNERDTEALQMKRKDIKCA